MRSDEEFRPEGIVPAQISGWALLLTGTAAPGPLERAVGLAGLDLVRVASQNALLDKIAGSKPDLVILDATALTDSHKIIARRIDAVRTTETLPVIVLSDSLETAPDTVRLAPASPLEEAFLVLRAALRRERPGALSDLRRAGRYALDEAGFRIHLRDRSAMLAKSDLCMIGPFFDAPERVFDRAFLERLAFNSERYRNGNRMIDFYLNRLRRELKSELGADPIRSVRGQGYALDGS